MVNNTKEPSDAHENTLKEEILQEITENFMEKILDVVKPKCTRCTQETSRYQK
jgi:hypothetical protein